ncbi:hypothetical protein ACW73L_20675 [Methylolobus aquaticus]
MLTIFVDTCVWWHWFTYRDAAQLENRIREHCDSFDEIYKLVWRHPERSRFLHNKRIELELGDRFKAEFEQKVIPVSTRVPIPLTRYDGAYCHDGSVLRGGRMGGSLRDLLKIDGHPHDTALAMAADNLKEGEKLYYKKPRKREFDIEHMESALEADASLFLTTDERTILKSLYRAAHKYEEGHPIRLIHAIAKTPTAALFRVRNELGP